MVQCMYKYQSNCANSRHVVIGSMALLLVLFVS